VGRTRACDVLYRLGGGGGNLAVIAVKYRGFFYRIVRGRGGSRGELVFWAPWLQCNVAMVQLLVKLLEKLLKKPYKEGSSNQLDAACYTICQSRCICIVNQVAQLIMHRRRRSLGVELEAIQPAVGERSRRRQPCTPST
jgi:hypothetical protein